LDLVVVVIRVFFVRKVVTYKYQVLQVTLGHIGPITTTLTFRESGITNNMMKIAFYAFSWE